MTLGDNNTGDILDIDTDIDAIDQVSEASLSSASMFQHQSYSYFYLLDISSLCQYIKEQLKLASDVPPPGVGRGQCGVGLQPGLGDPGLVLS